MHEPTNVPTDAPVETINPSAIPSFYPTTRTPTAKPSIIPTVHPSVPTHIPSIIPTVSPTRELYLNCGNCPNDKNTSCVFSSSLIYYLQCATHATECLYDGTRHISIMQGSSVKVVGGCEFKVLNAESFELMEDSCLEASSINITVTNSAIIHGKISTSGAGPQSGAGTPTSSGWGATYGGSGGRNTCISGTYYSNMNKQIGNINVFADIGSDVTLGSGGGVTGSGKGGGRIYISSMGNLNITKTGELFANGSSPVEVTETLGAGSGGSVLLSSESISLGGIISVAGGNGLNGTEQAGGGGGRVGIHVLSESSTISTYTKLLSNVSIILSGGTGSSVCNYASAGSLFMQVGPTTSSSSFVFVGYYNNVSDSSYATAIIDQSMNISHSYHGYYYYANVSVALHSNLFEEVSPLKYLILINSCVAFHGVKTLAATNLQMNATYLSVEVGHSDIQWNADYLLADNTSTIVYDKSSSFTITSANNLKMYGLISTSDVSVATDAGGLGDLSKLSATLYVSGSYVILSDIQSDNVVVQALYITIHRDSTITAANSASPSTCVSKRLADFTCDQSVSAMLESPGINTIVLAASTKLTHQEGSIVSGSLIHICSSAADVYHGAYITTDGRGCESNAGDGAGAKPDPSQGGSGGGYYGAGGSGSANIDTKVLPGGSTYGNATQVYAGSGGGSDTLCTHSNTTAAGGGVVYVNILKTFSLNGAISSNGVNNDSNVCANGGGAGGAVLLNVASVVMSGTGSVISASGAEGSGNSLKTQGGAGGGGGLLYIYNISQSVENRNTFSGTITATGGASYYMLGSSIKYRPTAGGTGMMVWPTCSSGYGNDYTTGALCQPCNTGTYSESMSTAPCLVCRNKPVHSVYINAPAGTSTSSNCPYDCTSGYTHNDCISPIEYFIFLCGGPTAVTFEFLVLWLFFILPLIYIRLITRNKWLQEKVERIRFTRFFYGLSRAGGSGSPFRSGGSFRESLLRGDSWAGSSRDTDDDTASVDAKRNTQRSISYTMNSTHTTKHITFTPKELRLGCRQQDSDLAYHACRLFLSGTNHPFQYRGGAWCIPLSRPIALRPTILRDKYESFAHKLNALLVWDVYSWEVASFLLCSLLFPSLSPSLLNIYRRRRTDALLNYIAKYNHYFFRSSVQRKELNSLRIGISPDNTLAYIDFLFEPDLVEEGYKPLSAIGQGALPASFRLSGYGTYFNPWYVDTNDAVLQAVAHSNLASKFIDENWINCISDLNNMLKSVHCNNIRVGLLLLLQYLNEENRRDYLGGLQLHLCTFNNYSYEQSAAEQMYPSDIAKRKRDIDKLHDVETFGCDMHGTSLFESNDSPDFGNRAESFGSHRRSMEWFNSPLLGFTSSKMSYKYASLSTNRMASSDRYDDSGAVRLDSDTEPQSVGIRDTRRSTTGNTIKDRSKAGIDSIAAISHSIEEGERIDDPDCCRLNYLCSEVGAGRLLLGICVSHASIKIDTLTQLCDSDYDSDTDLKDPYADDADNADSITGSSTNNNAQSIHAIPATPAQLSFPILIGNAKGIAPTEQAAVPYELSTSFHQKIKDLDRFYDIVHTAEKHIPRSDEVGDDNRYDHSASNDHSDSDATEKLRNNKHGNRRSSTHVSVFRKKLSEMEKHAKLARKDALSSSYQHSVELWRCNAQGKVASSLKCCYKKSNDIKYDDHDGDSDDGTDDNSHSSYNISNHSEVAVNNEISQSSVEEILSKPDKYRSSSSSSAYCIKIKTAVYQCMSIVSNFIYSRIFMNPITITLIGGNVSTSRVSIGMRQYKHILGFLILSLSVTDCVMAFAISFEFWCVWANPTTCVNHLPVYMLLVCPPGVFVAAPIWGIASILTNTAGSFIRTYAMLSRLAIIPAALSLWLYIIRFDVINFVVIYFVCLYFLSRCIQIYIVDVYVAITERMRTTRGWDGMFSSLYQAQDNTIEIID